MDAKARSTNVMAPRPLHGGSVALGVRAILFVVLICMLQWFLYGYRGHKRVAEAGVQTVSKIISDLPRTPCDSEPACLATATSPALAEWTNTAIQKSAWNAAIYGPIYKRIDKFDVSPSPAKFINWAQWAHGGETMKVHCYDCSGEGKREEHNQVVAYLPFMEAGSNAVDIGAKDGDTALSMAAAVSPGGTVVAFEPCFPKGILYLNTKLNPHLKVEVHEYAITDHDGEVGYGGFDNNGAIVDDRNAQWRLPGRVLYPFLRQHYNETFFEKLKFIKIDAEGHDAKIVRSIKNLLDDYKPTVKVEWFRGFVQGADDECSNDSRELFAAADYVEYDVFDTSGKVRIDCTNKHAKLHLDLIFKPRPKKENAPVDDALAHPDASANVTAEVRDSS